MFVEDPDELERAVRDHLCELDLAGGKEWLNCPKELAIAAVLETGHERGEVLASLHGLGQLGKVIEGVKFNDGIDVIQDSRAVA